VIEGQHACKIDYVDDTLMHSLSFSTLICVTSFCFKRQTTLVRTIAFFADKLSITLSFRIAQQQDFEHENLQDSDIPILSLSGWPFLSPNGSIRDRPVHSFFTFSGKHSIFLAKGNFPSRCYSCVTHALAHCMTQLTRTDSIWVSYV